MVSANSRSVRTRGPPVTPMAAAGGPLKQLESRLWRNNLILPAVRGKGLLDRQRHSGPEGPPYSADGSLAESADKAAGGVLQRVARNVPMRNKLFERWWLWRWLPPAAGCTCTQKRRKRRRNSDSDNRHPSRTFAANGANTKANHSNRAGHSRTMLAGCGSPQTPPPVFCRCMQEKRGCRRGDANVCEAKGHRWELF